LHVKDFEGNEGAVRAELERVLEGTAFASSPRSREFLRYVVEEALAGRGEQIKERSIAMAIFARGADYDPGEDSIVRVKAVEVRKRLAQHYASSPRSTLKIDLPQGRYVPKVEAPPTRSNTTAGMWLWAVGGTGICLLAAALLWTRAGSPGGLDALWGPLASRQTSVLIGLPSPEVWTVQGPPTGPIAPDAVSLAKDYYVGTGAAYGAAQVAAMLVARGGRFQIKVGQAVTYEDLKNQPAVFLGAYSSAWTMEFSKKLRFQLVQDGGRSGVIDTHRPGREWRRAAAGPTDQTLTEDYAVVARILDRGTGNPILLVAGCGPRGTHAASEFVSSADAFTQFTSVAPPDWPMRSFEVVLHAEVHGAVPGKPRVLAWHVW
jgi:hypothetical protein